MKKMFILSFAAIVIFGCAATYEASGAKDAPLTIQPAELSFPDYKGEKTRVAVLPLALTQKTIKDFPDYTAELRKKSVGFALWNRITENLYETKRFTFIEVSEEIVKKIIDQWWLGSSEMVDPSTALQMGKLKQAEDFIYGEITEFGVDTLETSSGFKSARQTLYRLGVQLRYVNGETLEFIPATGIGKGSSVEEASEQAIRAAILKMIQRME